MLHEEESDTTIHIDRFAICFFFLFLCLYSLRKKRRGAEENEKAEKKMRSGKKREKRRRKGVMRFLDIMLHSVIWVHKDV